MGCSALWIFAFLAFFCTANGSAKILPEAYTAGAIDEGDVDLLEFALNLEYLEAEFFLHGALGYGLDKYAPDLAARGATSKGGRKANLTGVVADVILEFAKQEVGHLRAIRQTVVGFPRPVIDLSNDTFAQFFDAAFNRTLQPAFDPYANDLHFLLASYLLPYVSLTGYVGISPLLKSFNATRLVGGLLAVEAGQDAVIRTLLYQRKDEVVQPYTYTVAEFTNRLSALRNYLGSTGDVDQGLVMPSPSNNKQSEGKILSGDDNYIAFSRTATQILEILYCSGDSSKPGGFFPGGANGIVSKTYETKVQRIQQFLNSFVFSRKPAV